MLAVVAARTNNEQAVYANLRKAASLDSSMKERAVVDKEFANYNVANLSDEFASKEKRRTLAGVPFFCA